MIFISKPSVYTLPGTWEKQPMIPHLHLTPDQGFILFFGLVLLGLVGFLAVPKISPTIAFNTGRASFSAGFNNPLFIGLLNVDVLNICA